MSTARRPDAPSAAGLDRGHQARIGLSLAVAIIVGWLSLHVYTVFFYPWGGVGTWLAPLVVLTLCWLYVGLFIIAHDCMHGSLVPFRPAINRRIGQLCLLLYAGFSFDRMNPKHHLHHRHSGTADDPDYDDRHPHGFWTWYAKFFAEYFSGRELVFIAGLTAIYWLLGAPMLNIWVFWALPAVLSSLQLFTFGTYLPHRPGTPGFGDRHNARSNDYPWLVSLLTCFHFGYHHEHHLHPGVPWWRLPAVRSEQRSSAG